MTKPRRYGWKSHPATPTQEQTRPISTETSNLDKKYAVFDVSCKNEHWKKKRCKLMTKPRRYGWKSHPATPTQEQTRPISTETSNLVKKYTVSDISCVNGHCRNKTLQADDQTAQIGGEISSRDANSGANETNINGNQQSIQKIRCFWYLLRKRAFSKQNVANWWPSRADMVENLIPRRQLRSKRDQYRRKLAI